MNDAVTEHKTDAQACFQACFRMNGRRYAFDVDRFEELVHGGVTTTSIYLPGSQLVTLVDGSQAAALSVQIVEEADSIVTTLYVQVAQERMPVVLECCMLSTTSHV